MFGDLKLSHNQNCDVFDAMQHFIILSKRFDWSPYAASYRLALYASTFDTPPPPSQPHSKQAEPLTSEIYIILVLLLNCLEINSLILKEYDNIILFQPNLCKKQYHFTP